ncbi:glycoside hydrolase family 13 protein [Anaerocolumna sp. AGMB13020]|uniref:glycoside hydrolase family 13 protein n=1 Tax=Anaerocolumna sp. AGMB13020 TaxID=3081750 RepID=UPI002953F7B4|nr:glycoside hydrolase family 13 protein [Anaerocolumna sp. AGMB13020]WOO37757.1 glycoside hydrolase family 13 protein [Anaerocolumna sp. AGMB13020]
MNKQAILHIPQSKYCYPIDQNSVVLRLRMDKNDAPDRVEVVYGCKYTFYMEQKTAELEAKYRDDLFIYYETQLTLEDVRLTYVFRIWKEQKYCYFSEDGITEEYNFKLCYYNSFQMPYINKNDIHEVVDWMRGAVFYEIFIDRFYQGKKEKDTAYINLDWGEIPNPKSFTGGDIPGITKKLDYIKGLGANGIYLTPVFCSISNHKYDISDYTCIDEQFGTNEDFAELVKEAHKRDMKIVLDAVFNHCSILLPQFQDVISKGIESEYFDWFIIDGDRVDMENLNYEVFGFSSYMPKFNTSNKAVQEFLLDIAAFWVKEYDIDGWRLDVSDEVSHDFWRKFRTRIKELKSDCVLIGENWHDAYAYLQGDQYDSIMNYAFTKACLDYYAFGTSAAKGFAEKLNQLLMRNNGQVNTMMFNLLDSHDTDRFYTSINKNKDKMLSALAVMNMYSGVPCIYYGTEICLEGGYDPDNRRCFDWDESHWDSSYMEILKKLLALKQKPALQSGDIRITHDDRLCYIRRTYKNSSVLLIVNQSGEAVELNRSESVLAANKLSAGSLYTDGFAVYEA